MPKDIADLFKAAEVSLFSIRSHDLQTDCSCPDWSNPCKHVAAVYYLLAEEFDCVPFLIFKLRGMNREELVERINGGATAAKAAEPELVETLPTVPSQFWGPPGEPSTGTLTSPAWPVTEQDDAMTGGPGLGAPELIVPVVAASLARRLGSFLFWLGEEPFLAAVEQVYRYASPLGMDTFIDDWRPVAASSTPPLPARSSLQRKAPAVMVAPYRTGDSATRGFASLLDMRNREFRVQLPPLPLLVTLVTAALHPVPPGTSKREAPARYARTLSRGYGTGAKARGRLLVGSRASPCPGLSGPS